MVIEINRIAKTIYTLSAVYYYALFSFFMSKQKEWAFAHSFLKNIYLLYKNTVTGYVL